MFMQATGKRYPCLALLGATAIVLSACVSTTTVVQPCCYVGDVELTRLETLELSLAAGGQVKFGEVFRGYQPATGLASTPLPFQRAEIRAVSLVALRKHLENYDANADTVIQYPELIVLYIHEAARGLGKPLMSPQGGQGAIATAQADIGGLMDYIDQHHEELDPVIQRLFADLDELGRDLRTSVERGGARDDKPKITP